MPSHLINLGSKPEMTSLFRKRLKVINSMLIVCTSNCFIYSAVLFYLDIIAIAQIVFALSVSFLVLLYLQAKYFTQFVRPVFLILLNLFIFLFAVALDKQVEVVLLFSILIIIPLFFYEYANYKKWLLFSLFSILLTIISLSLPNGNIIPIPQDQILVLRTIVWITLFFWITIFSYWTSYEYGRAELELIHYSKTLEKLLDTLTKNKRELQRVNAQLSEKNKDMNNIIHIISHDLKEPVQTLTTGVTMLQRQDIEQNLKIQLQKSIDFASKELDHMYSGIRKYSDVCMHNTLVPVDLNEVVDEVIQRQYCPNELAVSTNHLPVIKAHRPDMYTLFDELISNSIKYNDHKPAKINIELSTNNEATEFQLVYTDNSIGFGGNNEVFKMFFRKNDAAAKSMRGVGLALIKKIITFYGGSIINIPSKHGVHFEITI